MTFNPLMNAGGAESKLNIYVDQMEAADSRARRMPPGHDLLANQSISISSNPYNAMEDRMTAKTHDLFMSTTNDPNLGYGGLASYKQSAGANNRVTRKASKQAPAYHKFPFDRSASRDTFLQNAMGGGPSPSINRDYSLFGDL